MVEGKILIIFLYFDDLILMGDEHLIHSCKADLVKDFEMKDLGLSIISFDWKYGSEKVNCLCLKASILGRYWRSFTCKAASISTLLFQEIGERGCYIDRGSGFHCLLIVGGFTHVFS